MAVQLRMPRETRLILGFGYVWLEYTWNESASLPFHTTQTSAPLSAQPEAAGTRLGAWGRTKPMSLSGAPRIAKE